MDEQTEREDDATTIQALHCGNIGTEDFPVCCSLLHVFLFFFFHICFLVFQFLFRRKVGMFQQVSIFRAQRKDATRLRRKFDRSVLGRIGTDFSSLRLILATGAHLNAFGEISERAITDVHQFP